MHKINVGVDVGGTNIKLGLVSASGKILSRDRFATQPFIRSKSKLIQAIAQHVRDMLKHRSLKLRQVRGIGVGLPGLVNPYTGVVGMLPNIPGWRNVPFKKQMEDLLKIPTFIENDVNLIALGEWAFGAGKGYDSLICITLGTGVGGGLVFNNRLYRGGGFAAGEIGHIPLNEKGPRCNCGGSACLERYVGNRVLLADARRVFRRPEITLEDVSRLAGAGDRRALDFWKRVAEHIGNGLTGVVNVLNPSRIIIGGGVGNSFRFLAKPMTETIRRRSMKVQGRMVRIVKAKLGNDAGILGAGELVKEFLPVPVGG